MALTEQDLKSRATEHLQQCMRFLTRPLNKFIQDNLGGEIKEMSFSECINKILKNRHTLFPNLSHRDFDEFDFALRISRDVVNWERFRFLMSVQCLAQIGTWIKVKDVKKYILHPKGFNAIDYTYGYGYFGENLPMMLCFHDYKCRMGNKSVCLPTYYSIFIHLFNGPEKNYNGEHLDHLKSLIDLMVDYLDRVDGDFDFDELLLRVTGEFKHQHENDVFPGWMKENMEQGHSAISGSPCSLSLAATTKWEEVASSGLDRLMFCLVILKSQYGGTIKELCHSLQNIVTSLAWPGLDFE